MPPSPFRKRQLIKLYPIKDPNIKVRKRTDLRLNQLNCKILLVKDRPRLTCSSRFVMWRLHYPRSARRKSVSQKEPHTFLQKKLSFFTLYDSLDENTDSHLHQSWISFSSLKTNKQNSQITLHLDSLPGVTTCSQEGSDGQLFKDNTQGRSWRVLLGPNPSMYGGVEQVQERSSLWMVSSSVPRHTRCLL